MVLNLRLITLLLSGLLSAQPTSGAMRANQLEGRLFPVPLEQGLVIGARDRAGTFRSFRVHPYVGYSKNVGSWKLLLTMSDAYGDNLSRGHLGMLTEVLQVRELRGDSVAAEREFTMRADQVQHVLGAPRRCAMFRKVESRELRWEWLVGGRYFAVIHSRALSDERIIVQWGGKTVDPGQKLAEQCHWDAKGGS
jgi:hypothetical protein